MTAGTSLSEAALGRPSLLQAAVCYPGTSTDTPAHGAQHPAPVYPAPGPAPGTQSPPRAQPAPSLHHCQLTAPAPAPAVSTTRTASAQHRHRVSTAHSQLTAPSTSTTARTSTRRRHPARAPCMFPPHGQDQHPAPAPSSGTLSRKRVQPTGTSNLSSPRAQPAHSTSLFRKRARCYLKILKY